MAGPPPELPTNLGGVDRIAPVVAGPVGHERLQRAAAGADGRQFVEDVADQIDDLQVRTLVAAADVVLLTKPAGFERQQDTRAVIFDVHPVAHVAAVAVDRERTPFDGVQDHQRNQLLRELVGSVVVRAVGDDRRHAVRMEIRPDQMVCRRLARRIR